MSDVSAAISADVSRDSAAHGFFHLDESTRLNTVILRHLGDQGFELAQSFLFRGPSGMWRVDERELPNTDLTSVPWFYRWYVPTYGPHLLPALLHDALLLRDGFDRDRADDIFGEALALQNVAPVRRVIMIAAVTLATRWTTWARRLPLLIWFALAFVGISAFANGIFRWWEPSWWSVSIPVAATLAPIPAGILWGRHWLRGIVAGYTLIVLTPVTLVVWATRAITGLFEATVE